MQQQKYFYFRRWKSPSSSLGVYSRLFHAVGVFCYSSATSKDRIKTSPIQRKLLHTERVGKGGRKRGVRGEGSSRRGESFASGYINAKGYNCSNFRNQNLSISTLLSPICTDAMQKLVLRVLQRERERSRPNKSACLPQVLVMKPLHRLVFVLSKKQVAQLVGLYPFRK